jgi:very-short-patch-repair endonuclease
VHDIDHILTSYGGVASRDVFRHHGVSRHRLDNEVRSGTLLAVLPRTYCRPWDADLVDVREAAALRSVGQPAALSHLSALRRWQLFDDYTGPVHVTVPIHRLPRGSTELTIHRSAQFPPVVRLRGLVTTTVAASVAGSWPLIPAIDRRAPAILASRNRLVTPAELEAELARLPRLPGRSELAELIALLVFGCESELEIWGHVKVFDYPGLRHAKPQKWLNIRGRWYRLDRAYEQERVAVEMDGQRYHRSEEQRERDRRKDTALASIGWVCLRYSHARLHNDIPGCRRDTLATLASRP